MNKVLKVPLPQKKRDGDKSVDKSNFLERSKDAADDFIKSRQKKAQAQPDLNHSEISEKEFREENKRMNVDDFFDQIASSGKKSKKE